MGRVRTLAVLGRDLYAGGTFTRAGNVNTTNIAKWNGTEWEDMDGGVTHDESIFSAGTVGALAIGGNDLYVGGSFLRVGGIPASRIAKWDGRRWSELGSGIGGSPVGGDGRGVSELVCTGAELFLGGYFQSVGGASSTNIALWHIPHAVKIALASDHAVISWPATGSNFVLEAKGSLDDADWVEVMQPPEVGNEACIVTELMSSTNRFYRLRRKEW